MDYFEDVCANEKCGKPVFISCQVGEHEVFCCGCARFTKIILGSRKDDAEE